MNQVEELIKAIEFWDIDSAIYRITKDKDILPEQDFTWELYFILTKNDILQTVMSGL